MSDNDNAPREEVDEDALLAELRALALRNDPVPPEIVAAARSALAWRTMDAELAELTADSSVDHDDLALVRSAAVPTLITFESAALTVEIEIVDAGGARRLLGQLVPPRAGSVDVRHKGGTVTVAADEVGRFNAPGVAAGPVSLRCTAGAHVVETDWFLA